MAQWVPRDMSDAQPPSANLKNLTIISLHSQCWNWRRVCYITFDYIRIVTIVTVPPPWDRFAYGTKGDEDLKVPSEAALLCTVSLLDFKPEDNPGTLSVDHRQAIGWDLPSTVAFFGCVCVCIGSSCSIFRKANNMWYISLRKLIKYVVFL